MTTFGGHSVPFTIGEGGNPSFFISPLRMLDQEYHAIGSAAFDIDFRFFTNGSIPDENRLMRKEVDNVQRLVPNQRQWKINTSLTPLYSIRHVSFEGDGTPVFDFPTINVWLPMQNPEVFGMDRPAAGTSRFITFRVQIAETADTTTVLASALFTLRYTRP